MWGLCQQAHDHLYLEGGYSSLYQWNSATFMQKVKGNFQQKSPYVPPRPLRPFSRYAIAYITLYCILYELINIWFLIINLCFLSRLQLLRILGHPIYGKQPSLFLFVCLHSNWTICHELIMYWVFRNVFLQNKRVLCTNEEEQI